MTASSNGWLALGHHVQSRSRDKQQLSKDETWQAVAHVARKHTHRAWIRIVELGREKMRTLMCKVTGSARRSNSERPSGMASDAAGHMPQLKG